jgi:hypothetical protein
MASNKKSKYLVSKSSALFVINAFSKSFFKLKANFHIPTTYKTYVNTSLIASVDLRSELYQFDTHSQFRTRF